MQWKIIDGRFIKLIKRVLGWTGERYFRTSYATVLNRARAIRGKRDPPLSTMIRRRRLRRLGHVKRHALLCQRLGQPAPLQALAIYAVMRNYGGNFQRPPTYGWRHHLQGDLAATGLTDEGTTCASASVWKRLSTQLPALQHHARYGTVPGESLRRWHNSDESNADFKARLKKAQSYYGARGSRHKKYVRTSLTTEAQQHAARTVEGEDLDGTDDDARKPKKKPRRRAAIALPRVEFVPLPSLRLVLV